MFMGHRRAKTNDMYGVYEPDYLDAAKTAVDAVLRALNAACKKASSVKFPPSLPKRQTQKTRLKGLK